MLYINTHEPLAYDETKMFRALGWDVEHSLPNGSTPTLGVFRPAETKTTSWTVQTLSSYDCIVVVHWVETLLTIYDAIPDKHRLVWRTMGKGRPHDEDLVRTRAPGTLKVRHSPRERSLQAYAGENAVIRFGKSPEEFGGWTGESTHVMVMGNSFGARSMADHDLMLEALDGLDWDLYGAGNESQPHAIGLLSYDDIKAGLRKASAYFYPHSSPAPSTLNFIEALMTGVPVVGLAAATIDACWRQKHTEADLAGQLYEIEDIISNGTNGFIVRDAQEAKEVLTRLLKDPELGARIGTAGRQTAIDTFSVETTKQAWKVVLGSFKPRPKKVAPPTSLPTFTSRPVFEALTLLRPYDIDLPKVRIGPRGDGGYVLADTLGEPRKVFSYGIGANPGFDRAMADRGHAVYMFDHTIPGDGLVHPRWTFRKEGIGGTNTGQLRTLEHHVEQFEMSSTNMILKMDVEGAEWEALMAAPDDVLRQFDQIVIEIHWLNKLADPTYRETFAATMSKLNRLFTLFHVHANNHAKLVLVQGFVVPDVMELSYIRSPLVQRRNSETVYPTPFDGPNHELMHDQLLLFYPFMPTSGWAMFDDVSYRNDAQLRLRMAEPG